MREFTDLNVWSKSHKLVLSVYRITGSFPIEELYGLTSQMRRSAASVPSNIAEGCGRASNKDFKRFLSIALGSISEFDYQLLLSKDLDYITSSQYNQTKELVDEVKKMLSSFIKKLE